MRLPIGKSVEHECKPQGSDQNDLAFREYISYFDALKFLAKFPLHFHIPCILVFIFPTLSHPLSYVLAVTELLPFSRRMLSAFCAK